MKPFSLPSFQNTKDSSIHVDNQPSNILIIKQFRGEPEDNELYNITNFLRELALHHDVRPVSEKYTSFNETALKTSIPTKGLGDRTYETKLIQILNNVYQHKPRELKKPMDKSLFDGTDEVILQSDLSEKMSTLNIKKRLLFEMVRSHSPKKPAKQFEAPVCFDYDVQIFEEKNMESGLPAQDYAIGCNALHYSKLSDNCKVRSIKQL